MAVERDGLTRRALLAVETGVITVDDWLQMDGIARLREFDGRRDGLHVFADADIASQTGERQGQQAEDEGSWMSGGLSARNDAKD